MDWQIFYTRLKELRAEKGLSTMQLGKAIGVSDAAILYWEQGVRVPGIDNLYKIAKFFNVPAGWLIGLED